MSIAALYRRGDPVISFEFFPPKTDAGFRSLYRTIEELKHLGPGFVSVTMGAGGSTRSKTVDLVIQIQSELGLQSMAHLPCLGFERSEIADILDNLEAEAASHGVNYMFNVVRESHPDPEGITRWLRARGFEPSHDRLRRRVGGSGS